MGCVSTQQLTLRDLEVDSDKDITVETFDAKHFQMARREYKILRNSDSSLALKGTASNLNPSQGNIGSRFIVTLTEAEITWIESRESTYIVPVLIIAFLIAMARFGATFSL